jgi:EAL domain-containing protein (putative c-di-GMP-specific phosphodiesterase class I)
MPPTAATAADAPLRDRADPRAPGLAWIAVPDAGEAGAIAAALAAGGWRVGHAADSLGALQAALTGAAVPPSLIVGALRFADGDALQLVRTLARRALPTSLFLVGDAPRAVVAATRALADACGVAVAGSAAPADAAAAIARALADFTPRAPATRRRGADAPLDEAELLDLLDRGALHPWLQPKLDLATRGVVGFEALMRAHDAAGTLVMPARLISALGAHGLLDEATMHMARQTVAFVATCLGEGFDVGASINVAMRSLANLAFCQELERTVARAGVDPQRIAIEIAEADAAGDPALMLENTTRVRLLGFDVSIDHFASAGSNLRELARAPFTELKIERSLVADIDTDPGRQAVVAACARFGRALGRQVVAEGVETEGELATLERLGCTQVQGYLVSRPLPAAEALAWLRAQRGRGHGG